MIYISSQNESLFIENLDKKIDAGDKCKVNASVLILELLKTNDCVPIFVYELQEYYT